MYNKDFLMENIKKTGIRKNGTLLIHSSMRAVGQVEGGADTVLDAFIEYMKDGLLLFPTHSWSDKNLIDGIYNPKTEATCVGILPNLFLERHGVVRSMHPTHSVGALGKRAKDYIKRDNEVYTPCPANGGFSGLYHENAQLLFLGTPLTKNTYIHSIEEKLEIPNRINKEARKIKLMYEDGREREIELYGHHSSLGDVSLNYGKLLTPMLNMGMAKEIKIGDAVSYLVEVKPMSDWVTGLLISNPDLFSDDKPITNLP